MILFGSPVDRRHDPTAAIRGRSPSLRAVTGWSPPASSRRGLFAFPDHPPLGVASRRHSFPSRKQGQRQRSCHSPCTGKIFFQLEVVGGAPGHFFGRNCEPKKSPGIDRGAAKQQTAVSPYGLRVCADFADFDPCPGIRCPGKIDLNRFCGPGIPVFPLRPWVGCLVTASCGMPSPPAQGRLSISSFLDVVEDRISDNPFRLYVSGEDRAGWHIPCAGLVVLRVRLPV